jgi:hypothetical protein
MWRSDTDPDVVAPVLDDLPALAGGRLVKLADRNPPWFWGNVDSWRPESHEVMLARVNTVVLLFNDVDAAGIVYGGAAQGRGSPTGGSVEKVFAEIDGWFERLRLWVRAIVSQDVDADVEKSGVTVAAQGLEALTIEGAVVSAPRTANNITVNMQDIEPLDEQAWKRALRLTNQGISPPVEWSLIGTARAQVHLGQLRRGVVDAAAAVELGLATYLNACIASLPTGLQTTLSRDDQTLGWLIKTPARTGNMPASVSDIWQQFPSDIESGLLGIRNDVVHRNQPATYVVANRAVEIAAEVVRLVAPLPA